MTNIDKKARTERLKALREVHKESVAATQEMLKEQQAVRRTLKKAMQAGPMTVPQIAEAAEMPADRVLWHVTAMKKYDLVVEVGQDGEYYLYSLANGKEENA